MSYKDKQTGRTRFRRGWGRPGRACDIPLRSFDFDYERLRREGVVRPVEPRALTLSKGLVPFVTDGCRPVPSGSATCGQALLETTTTLSLEQLGIVRQQVSPDPSVNSMLFMDLNEAFAASSGLGTAFLFASPMGGLRRASDIFGRTTVRSRSRATRQRLRSE